MSFSEGVRNVGYNVKKVITAWGWNHVSGTVIAKSKEYRNVCKHQLKDTLFRTTINSGIHKYKSLRTIWFTACTYLEWAPQKEEFDYTRQ